MEESVFDLVLCRRESADATAAIWVFWDCAHQDGVATEVAGISYRDDDSAEFKQKILDMVERRSVMIVGITFSYDLLRQLKRHAMKIVVLDHQKNPPISHKAFSFYHSDPERTPSQMAWDYLYPGRARPWFLEVAAARYLRKATEEDRAYYRGITLLGQWELPFLTLLQNSTNKALRRTMLEEGRRALEPYHYMARYHTKDATIHIGEDIYHIRIMACDHPFIRPDVGDLITEESKDFALIYSYNLQQDNWYYTLHQPDGGTLKLTLLAQKLGGEGYTAEFYSPTSPHALVE